MRHGDTSLLKPGMVTSGLPKHLLRWRMNAVNQMSRLAGKLAVEDAYPIAPHIRRPARCIEEAFWDTQVPRTLPTRRRRSFRDRVREVQKQNCLPSYDMAQRGGSKRGTARTPTPIQIRTQTRSGRRTGRRSQVPWWCLVRMGTAVRQL